MTQQSTNWAGNVAYQSTGLNRPHSLDEVRELVAGLERIKVLGSRHSFNGIGDTTGVHISLERLNRIVDLDRDARTVTIEAGVRYGDLGVFLHREGFALHNLASLPHISIAGACATATHGSGDRNGNLGVAVVALEMVDADGSLFTLRKDVDEDFSGAVVGLGALGVVTKLKLVIEPTFDIRQHVYERLPFDALEDGFESIASSAYSVSLFTDWQRPEFHQAWLKHRERDLPPAMPASSFFGASPASGNRHPLPGHPPVNCTQQMGVPGPWHERLPHFRMEFTPSSGEELQSEYFVPRRFAWPALQALDALRAQIAPHVFVTEVRTISADDLWMSPFCERDTVAFHFTWRPDQTAVETLLPLIEEQLEPFEPRPHWSKLFSMPADLLKARYPRFNDFRALARRYDPHGKFRNEFLAQVVIGDW